MPSVEELKQALSEAEAREQNPAISEYKPDQVPPPQTGPVIGEGTPSGSVDAADIQNMINQALERQQQQHADEMAQLRGEVTAAGVTASANLRAASGAMIGPHAAGPNDEVAPTWSQAEQEEMRAADIENARAVRKENEGDQE
jgi:hypothetical protein